MTGVLTKILATLVVAGICVGVALFILDSFENPTNEFATYSEMEANGWMPKVIPKSAFQISETHNLDTNVVQISFRYKPGDISIAEDECRSTSALDVEAVFDCTEGILTLTDDGYGYFASE